MDNKLEKRLFNAYPNLYRNAFEEKHPLYVSTGNGWYGLIKKYSKKIEKMILELPENKQRFYRAVQVKQKFGGLRIYMYDRTPEMRDLLDDLERESMSICEVCGRQGKLVQIPGRWITVSCDDHAHITRLDEMEKINPHWTVTFKNVLSFYLNN